MITRIILFTFSVLISTTVFSQCIGTQGQIKWYYWEGIPGNNLADLYTVHDVPQSPKGFEIITELKSPGNYAEGLGAIAKGFIKVEETNTYKFNITSAADAAFFLSTTQSPSDTSLTAEIDGWSYVDEHTKYPEQTSDPITLTAGEYYYFEFHQKDDNGWDHAQVYWQTSPTDNTWSIVPNVNLYNYDCYVTCPVKGTPCLDGDPNTVDDQEDGNCNCIGTPTNLDPCVGERGSIRAMYWDDIPGGDIHDLHSSPNYPMKPDRTELLTTFQGPSPTEGTCDSCGTRVRAMLLAPLTGTYYFNVTGDDETWLYLSTSEDYELANVVAEVPNWTYKSEHEKYISQTSEAINLVKGQLYYLEINHKQARYSHHFTVYWKTPNQTESWKVLDGVYLYYYGCDDACIPEGTPCDDGDETTHSDAYDENCNCVGTPCPNGDCTGLGYNPSFPSYDECGPTDKHNAKEEDAWLSCVPSPSPNPARADGHWIQYDFNEPMVLGDMKIWNYNVGGETGNGFKDVIIDYSVDGINWIELGQFNWQEAPGVEDYEGFEGPDFGGVQARYVLITALNSFDNTACMGFSQVQFVTTACANAGVTCDNGSEEAAVYDIYCDCRSLSDPFNDCANVNLELHSTPINTNNYSAKATIESRGFVSNNSTVNMIAGESVTLLPGFTAKKGSKFLAAIIPCSDYLPNAPEEEDLLAANDDETVENRAFIFEDQSTTDLVVYPTPTNSWTNINFNIEKAARVSINIFDNNGKLLYTLAKNQFYEAGSFEKVFPAQKLARGMYYVVLQTEENRLTKSMVVVDNVQ